MDKHHFKSATGLELKVFDSLFTFLNPGENCDNIKYYDTKKRVQLIPLTHLAVSLEKKHPKNMDHILV